MQDYITILSHVKTVLICINTHLAGSLRPSKDGHREGIAGYRKRLGDTEYVQVAGLDIGFKRRLRL